MRDASRLRRHHVPQRVGGIVATDAGTSSGGGYTLKGGFWSGAVAPGSAAPPLLSVTLTTSNKVLVSWPVSSGDWRLQYTSELRETGTVWSELQPPCATNCGKFYILDPAVASRRFFRLHSP